MATLQPTWSFSSGEEHNYKLVGHNSWCNLCHALHDDLMTTPRNVNWGSFWNPKTDCDGHFLKKVLGPNKK